MSATARQILLARLIKAQIDADYRTHITEIVARIDGLTSAAATKIFTLVYDQTPISYRRCRRWLSVRKLLVRTVMPFYEIALQTGFRSRGHFYREVEYMSMGLSPARIRERGRI